MSVRRNPGAACVLKDRTRISLPLMRATCGANAAVVITREGG